MNALSVEYLTAGRLAVEIHPSREALGLAAARTAAASLRSIIAAHGEARVIFACAPSQNEFLSALLARLLQFWCPFPVAETAL